MLVSKPNGKQISITDQKIKEKPFSHPDIPKSNCLFLPGVENL